MGELLGVFSSVLNPFSLTTEVPERGTIRFLDMSLTFCGHHVCWKYAPRSQKGFLPFSSAHTKLVKRGIVQAALKNSVLRSCHHKMFQSLQAQAERLLIAGYPRTLLLTVAESVLKSTTSKEAPQTQETRRGRINVIPYVHKVSHGLKKIAQKAGIRTVFSAPNKIGRMCKAVNDTTPPKAACSTNHATRFVPCRTNVVYEIPLKCDAVYVGQTGRCLNERLREHAYALRVGSGSHLVSHCKACGCSPLFERTKVLKRYTESRTREIFEAYSIAKRGEKCVSQASVALLQKEIAYIDR